MVAFLAALPMIFSAIKTATDLFDAGKKVVADIKGEPSSAATPDDLQAEVENMTDDQRASFIDTMSAEIQAYNAVSERLTQQGGQIDASTLNAIPQEERGRVALMRMTTRPWAVRWMVIAVVFPPLAAVAVNIMISLYNIVLTAFWPELPRLAQLSLGEVLNELYLTMVGWAAGVIMTYMGMREIGKAVGHKDDVSLSDMAGSVRSIFNTIKGVVK